MVEKPGDVDMRPASPTKDGGGSHSASSLEMRGEAVQRGDGQGLDTIRTRIEHTEAELAETLDAIHERISFDYIKQQAEEKLLDALERRARDMMNTAGRMTGELGHSIIETVKENPIPATLLGIGLSWLIADALNAPSKRRELMMGRYDIEGEEVPEELYQAGLEELGGSEYMQGGPSSGYKGRIRSAAERVREKAGSAQHRAGHLAEETAEKARHLGSGVRGRAGQAGSKAVQFVGDNTMVLGIAAVTMGAVFGLLLPRLSREGRILEGARETIVDKTRELGHKAMEKAERVAAKAGRAAREEAERQHLIGHGA